MAHSDSDPYERLTYVNDRCLSRDNTDLKESVTIFSEVELHLRLVAQATNKISKEKGC